jgi:hypothetical protein
MKVLEYLMSGVHLIETLFTENIRLLEQYCRLALRLFYRPLLRAA